jgi:hypothetical protein
VERTDGEWESGSVGERGSQGAGEWERENRLFSPSLALAPSLSYSPALSVPRGTYEVHYISLIRTRNQQALYLLIM